MTNKIDVYSCRNGHDTVTCDIDEGTTPLQIQCPVCSAAALSKFYDVPQDLQPQYEFYKPSSTEGLSAEFKEEVERGGLIKRPVQSDRRIGGIKNKYVVKRADGKKINPGAVFFVLRLDENGDPIHVAACRKALLVYADEIEEHLPELAQEIRCKYG